MLDVSRSPSKKNISGPNIQIRTSKTAVFKVLAGQLRNNRHWQGHQRARAKKRPIRNNTSNK